MTNEEAIKELKEDRALYESDIIEAGGRNARRTTYACPRYGN